MIHINTRVNDCHDDRALILNLIIKLPGRLEVDINPLYRINGAGLEVAGAKGRKGYGVHPVFICLDNGIHCLYIQLPLNLLYLSVVLKGPLVSRVVVPGGKVVESRTYCVWGK